MIPWDDDIDICLMREEYNELIKILPKELPYGFVVAGMYASSERLQKAAFVPQLRVIADETLWDFNDYMQYFHGFPYQRVGIDIFPIDYISRNNEFTDIQKEIISLGIMILAQWDKLQKANSLKQYIMKLSLLCNIDIELNSTTQNRIWKIIDNVSALCYKEESDYVTEFQFYIENVDYKIPKEYYNDTIKMPFENISINAPAGYDQVLRAEFGDYMTPVKGSAEHDYPFYGHMEHELIRQIRNVGFKGTVDEFCEEVSSGRLRV